MTRTPRIGVLALQRDVVPGGESATSMRLMRQYGLDAAAPELGGPILGTCAGVIVLGCDLGLVDGELAQEQRAGVVSQ